MTESKGFLRLAWARDHMPVIAEIRKRFQAEKPFKGIKVAMALHVEAKTGIFALLLKEGGAEVKMASCNPLSSDDSVVQSLKEDYGMPVFARKGETSEEYYEYLHRTLDVQPDIIIDDGGDLTKIVHTERKDLAKNILGGNEETTTGVQRLRAMERSGVLLFPMFDVNDANMKHLFDNRYGTGQSTLDGIMNATNLLIAGRTVVVAGYGYCGRGIAMRLKGMGANVIVTEIDPIKANEAIMDGFQVRRMNNAIRDADMVITATGMKDVVKYEDALVAKKNIVLANAGHFNNEVAMSEIEKRSLEVNEVREFVKRYRLENGNTVDIIADGRLVNLAAGQGHPVEIMDLSFALQALTAEYLVKNHDKLERKVYPVPADIDRYVAEIRLKQFGGELDQLNEEQIKYLNSWDEGT